MITSGEKTEEYREIKPYWIKRLMDDFTFYNDGNSCLYNAKEFDVVTFITGYTKNAPRISFEVKDIVIDRGLQIWGAEQGKKYFVIKLGKQITH